MSDASSTVSMRASGGGGRCKGCGTDHEPGSPSCPMSRIGTMLAGRYRIERLIGFGGMGAVYGAENISLGRKVAIKVLHPAMAARPDVVDRFRREARSVAGLRHDGFAHVYALDTDERGQFFIEMELLEGDPIDRLIANGPVPIDRCIAIIESALEALAVAHAAGLVHRDLKPENLFVRTDGKVKVLDFGIARVSDEARRLTGSGQFMGTLTYASVEQLRDASTVDARSDVYSFGATAFELVTGANVCGRGSYADVITRIMTDKIERSIRARRADAPEWLDALIARALAMNPAERFADARDMLAALRAARGPAQVRARASRAPILIALAILVAGGVVATVLLTRPSKQTAAVTADAMSADPTSVDASIDKSGDGSVIDQRMVDRPAPDGLAVDKPVVDASAVDKRAFDASTTEQPRDASVVDQARDASVVHRPAVDAAAAVAKTADQLNAEGKEHMYAGRFAEAAAVYKQLVRVAPIAKYYFNLCTALYSNGEYDAATQACNTGLARNPDAALKEKFQKLLERIAGSR